MGVTTRNRPVGRPREPVYALALALLRPYIALFFRLRVVGTLPSRGPVLVVANHVSYTDPVLLVSTLDRRGRRARFLATAALFSLPLLGWVARQVRYIPVDRHRGRQTLEEALAALKAGETVVVYPEGHIARPDANLRPKRGAAWLARMSGVPVVPVAQWGMQRDPRRFGWLRRRDAAIVFGAPLTDLPRDDRVGAETIAKAINDLLPEAKAATGG